MLAALTRQTLEAMSEPDLHTQVLQPLFRAMGYEDVEVWHGGTLEQGKDLVMWKRASDGVRVNYAVVAKTGPLRGRASGRGSAAEVTFQVQQTLRQSYRDPVTGTRQRIDRVFVVTNGRILKEAIHAITGALRKSECAKIEEFIGLDRLWKLLNEFHPQRTLLDRLQKAGDELGSTVDGLTVQAEVRRGKTTLAFFADAATERLPEISGSLSFDSSTKSGRANLEALRRHHETGEATVLQDVGIAMHLPPGMQRLVGTLPTRGTAELGERRSTYSALCRPRFTSDDGHVVVFDPVQLRVTRGGTASFLIEGTDAVGWTWSLEGRVSSQECAVRVGISLASRPATLARELAATVSALSRGGQLRFVDLATGRTLLDGVVPAGAIGAPNAGLVALLSVLVEIAERGGPTLQLPEHMIRESDLVGLGRIHQIVTTGVEEARVSHCWCVIAPQKERDFGDERNIQLRIPMHAPAPISVWGTHFDPGAAAVDVRGLRIEQADSNMACTSGVTDESDGSRRVQLVAAVEGNNAVLRYMAWPTDRTAGAL